MLAFTLLCMAPGRVHSQTAEVEPLVPQNLLKLIHTPQVQKELGLEGDTRLLDVLKKIDRVWWPSRILPEAKQAETTRELEEQLRGALKKILSPETMQRLREVEIQSQGTRALLRPDVADVIGLDDQKMKSFKTTVLATDSLAKQSNEKRGGDNELEKQLQAAREKEQSLLEGLLSSAQRRDLGKLVGKPELGRCDGRSNH